MLAGEVAGLRYMLGSAVEWASHGHVPPPEVVAAWRDRVDGAAGVAGCRGDDGAGAELDARPGLETPGGRFETGRSPVAGGVMTTRAPVPELVDVDVVAALLGLTRKGVYQLVQDRRIPHLRIGGGARGRLRFDLSDVRQWLEESRVPSREERP